MPATEIVLAETDWIAPINSGARVNGNATNVSELLRQDAVVKPTGSLVAVVCAALVQASSTTHARENEKVSRMRIRRIFALRIIRGR